MSGHRSQDWGWFDALTTARWLADRALLPVLGLAAVVMVGFGHVQVAGLLLLAAAVWEQHQHLRRLLARVTVLEQRERV